jgi:O-succinylbenzoic acid--CoA ligase
MGWSDHPRAATRREVHFGDRVVRCFADRPADTYAVFERALARCATKEAVVAGELRLTYRDLEEIVDRTAAGFAQLGVRANDRIGVLVGNRAEYIVTVLAALRIGAIAVPIGTRLVADEIHYILGHCGANLLIYESEQGATVAALGPLPGLRHRICCPSPAAGIAFDGLPLDAPKLPARQAAPEEDTAFILYTSGTTGRPKGAILTHFNVAHSLRHFELAQALGPHERSLLAVPGTHVTGLVAIILSMFNVGGAVLVLPAFRVQQFLELAARERMTHTVLVPAMYNLCLLDPGFTRHDLSAWRLGSYGGAPMPEVSISALGAKLPHLSLMNGYGATETASPTSVTPIGEALERRDTIGLPLHCAEVIVVDEHGRELPAGSSGEIWIKGPMVIPGYWQDPEATAASFTGGFWHSGDVGFADAEGYLHLLDRKKDIINRGGYKVASVEVENILAQHPGVLEAAVIAKPCSVLGERVHAFVSRKAGALTERDLSAFCDGRLADYKLPESYTLVDEPLPRNGAGKLLKRSLREQLARIGS